MAGDRADAAGRAEQDGRVRGSSEIKRGFAHNINIECCSMNYCSVLSYKCIL